jgi:hypothetical protein
MFYPEKNAKEKCTELEKENLPTDWSHTKPHLVQKAPKAHFRLYALQPFRGNGRWATAPSNHSDVDLVHAGPKPSDLQALPPRALFLPCRGGRGPEIPHGPAQLLLLTVERRVLDGQSFFQSSL